MRGALCKSKIKKKKYYSIFHGERRNKKVLTRNCIHESFNENNNNKLHVAQRLKTIITIAARNSFSVLIHSAACWLFSYFFCHFHFNVGNCFYIFLRLLRAVVTSFGLALLVLQMKRQIFHWIKNLFSVFSFSIEIAQLDSRKVAFFFCFSFLPRTSEQPSRIAMIHIFLILALVSEPLFCENRERRRKQNCARKWSSGDVFCCDG